MNDEYQLTCKVAEMLKAAGLLYTHVPTECPDKMRAIMQARMGVVAGVPDFRNSPSSSKNQKKEGSAKNNNSGSQSSKTSDGGSRSAKHHRKSQRCSPKSTDNIYKGESHESVENR
jgi:hypothetical protein